MQGTTDYGIWYKPTSDTKIHGYSLSHKIVADSKLHGYIDSDCAGSEDDMKSTSGYVFALGCGISSWASKKQETVAQSSVDAEYVVAVSC